LPDAANHAGTSKADDEGHINGGADTAGVLAKSRSDFAGGFVARRQRNRYARERPACVNIFRTRDTSCTVWVKLGTHAPAPPGIGERLAIRSAPARRGQRHGPRRPPDQKVITPHVSDDD
jgi:hypothetical protein